MICPICAASIKDGLKFCPKCGNPIIAESYQEPVQQSYQPPVNDYQAPVQQTYQPPVNDYQAPVQQTYQPPVNDYQAPVQQAYQPPVNDCQPSYNDYGYDYAAPVAQAPSNKGAKIAGLICSIGSLTFGVIALLLFCIPVAGIPLGFLGLILGIVGFILAKKSGANKGLAIAGLVCSVLSMSGAVIGLILAMLGLTGEFMSNF